MITSRGWNGMPHPPGAPAGVVGNAEITREVLTNPGVAPLDIKVAQKKTPSVFWLKINEPVTDDPPKPRPPPAPVKDELCALGVWPGENDPASMKVGQELQFAAVGIFLHNPWDLVDLTKRATWEASPQLQPLGGGRFRATQPGRYSIRGRVFNQGRWMEVTVPVVVSP
jgi:hypothetical protein